MAVYNRYSQIQQPLQFVPRSVDQLSKTGMMKATRDINQYQYANMLDTNYDVFNEQSEYVDGELEQLKGDIDTMVDEISNNVGGNRINELTKLQKEYDSKLGMNSKIWNMMEQKRSYNQYQQDMMRRYDTYSPGAVEGLIGESRNKYLNNWQDDKSSKFSGDLGVKDSKYIDKARTYAMEIQRNPTVIAKTWMGINDLKTKTLADGSTVYFGTKGGKKVEFTKQDLIKNYVSQMLSEDQNVVGDLEQRTRLGLMNGTPDQIINDLAQTMEDAHRVDRTTMSDYGYWKVGQTSAPTSNSRRSTRTNPNSKEPVRVDARESEWIEKLDAINDAKDGTYASGDYNKTIKFKNYSKKLSSAKRALNSVSKNSDRYKEIVGKINQYQSAIDDLGIDTEVATYAYEKLNENPEYKKIRKEMDKLVPYVNMSFNRNKYGGRENYNNVKKGYIEKYDKLEEKVNTMYNDALESFKPSYGYKHGHEYDIDPLDKVSNAKFKEVAPELSNYLSTNLQYAIGFGDASGVKVSDLKAMNVIKSGNYGLDHGVKVDTKNNKITFYAFDKSTDTKGKVIPITIDLNKITEQEADALIKTSKELFNGQATGINALYAKNNIKQSGDSFDTPTFEDKEGRINGVPIMYSMNPNSLDENGNDTSELEVKMYDNTVGKYRNISQAIGMYNIMKNDPSLGSVEYNGKGYNLINYLDAAISNTNSLDGALSMLDLSKPDGTSILDPNQTMLAMSYYNSFDYVKDENGNVYPKFNMIKFQKDIDKDKGLNDIIKGIGLRTNTDMANHNDAYNIYSTIESLTKK